MKSNFCELRNECIICSEPDTCKYIHSGNDKHRNIHKALVYVSLCAVSEGKRRKSQIDHPPPPNEIETVCNAYGTGLTTYFPHSTKCCVAGTLAIVGIDTPKSQKTELPKLKRRQRRLKAGCSAAGQCQLE